MTSVIKGVARWSQICYGYVENNENHQTFRIPIHFTHGDRLMQDCERPAS